MHAKPSLRACSSGLQVDRRGPVNVDVIRLKFSMEFPMIQKLLLFAAAVMPFSYSPVGAQTPQVAKPSLEFRLASDSATAGWKEMSAPKSEKTLFVSNDVAQKQKRHSLRWTHNDRRRRKGDEGDNLPKLA